jgi:O-acetyl-ADP-ribose deacetylase (regulator of RNase III)
MIKYADGDLFEVEVDIRVNTVNCVGVMGAGVALAFKRRYPAMFRNYVAKCRRGEIRPGKVDIWKSLSGEWVINFPTKMHWREHSRYEFIEAGLADLRSYLALQPGVTVAMPAVGCGHGGLDWTRVRAMIEKQLGDLNTTVYAFEPEYSRKLDRSELTRALTGIKFEEMGLPDRRFGNVDGAEDHPESLGRRAFIRGDAALMSRRWIGLVPSKKPAEQEWAALEALALAMGSREEQTTIALIHSARTTERIAHLFLEHGVAVVLVLPFGPLTTATAALSLENTPGTNFAVVSVAKARAPWTRQGLESALSLLGARAESVLLTDPKPEWLATEAAQKLLLTPTFYVAYALGQDESRDLMRFLRARPMGKRIDSGQLNIAPLYIASEGSRQGEPEVNG